MPLITGARLGCVTVRLNAARRAMPPLPSLTLMPIALVMPTFAVVGVPVSAPVLILKLAQAGLLEILNVKGFLSKSLAAGVKLYAFPTLIVVNGVPFITGIRFGCMTVRLNAARRAMPPLLSRTQ
ncbi:MAG: hypothetical protein ABL933_09270 [Methyloglobulus sp.]|nr:hypothetical protein [Methyloglobulus sp.]